MSIQQMEDRLDAKRSEADVIKGKRMIEKMKRLKLLEKVEEEECKHDFEWMRPLHKRICVHCGEESTDKFFVTEKKDLLRYKLTFAIDD